MNHHALDLKDWLLVVGTAAGMLGAGLLSVAAGLLFLSLVCLALFGLHLYAESR